MTQNEYDKRLTMSLLYRYVYFHPFCCRAKLLFIVQPLPMVGLLGSQADAGSSISHVPGKVDAAMNAWLYKCMYVRIASLSIYITSAAIKRCEVLCCCSFGMLARRRRTTWTNVDDERKHKTKPFDIKCNKNAEGFSRVSPPLVSVSGLMTA